MSENRKQHNHFDMREDGTSLWAVFDILTGVTTEVNGMPQDGLDIEVVDDLVNLLNAEYNARRKVTTRWLGFNSTI